MKRGRIIWLLMAVFMVVPFVSADIIFDELHSLYNVGDLIKVQECRPLSKIIHSVVIEKIKDKEGVK